MNEHSKRLARFYQSSVPWIIDEQDMKIIDRLHGTEIYNHTTQKTERVSKEYIVEKLWRKAVLG